MSTLIGETASSSVTRSYSDLRPAVFLASTALFAGVRTAVQHPFTVCLALKQSSASFSALSALSAMQHIVSTYGYVGLTRGLLALSVGTAISEVVYFWLYEWMRETVPLSKAFGDGMSGYVSDAASRLFFNPAMVVAYRQIAKPQSPLTYADVGRQVLREKGIRGLYTGMGLTLAVGCQWTAGWWVIYQQSKSLLYDVDCSWLKHDVKFGPASRVDNPLLNGASSIIASVTTAIAFNPFLVVRTRMQMQPHATMRGVVSEVFRRTGWRGFFHGTALSTVLCVGDGLLVSSSYECARFLATER